MKQKHGTMTQEVETKQEFGTHGITKKMLDDFTTEVLQDDSIRVSWAWLEYSDFQHKYEVGISLPGSFVFHWFTVIEFYDNIFVNFSHSYSQNTGETYGKTTKAVKHRDRVCESIKRAYKKLK